MTLLNTSSQPKTLYPHEWLAVVTLILVLVAITFATRTLDSSPLSGELEEPHYLVSQEIEVTITGAVSNPGLHRLKRDAKVGDLLKVAKPLEEADLRKIKQASKLREGQHLHVPGKEMIAVHIEGAVKNPATLRVPKGTKVEELLAQCELLPDANIESLKKKRRLKDGDVVKIPSKKTKKMKQSHTGG